MSLPFKLILVSPDDHLLECWREDFLDVENIEITKADDNLFQDVDVIVATSNSFGQLDANVIKKCGCAIQYFIKRKITHEYNGELLVGQAFSVPLNNKQRLICAPTMRIPQPVTDTKNAYLAFRAILIHCKEQNIKGCVLVPGLCDGIGNMHPRIISHQMKVAYNTVLGRKFFTIKEAIMYDKWLSDPDQKPSEGYPLSL